MVAKVDVDVIGIVLSHMSAGAPAIVACPTWQCSSSPHDGGMQDEDS